MKRDIQPQSAKKIGKAKTGVQGMSDAKTPKDIVVRQDPPHFITCFVSDPVRGFTITFDPKLLEEKIKKYGDRLRLPESINNEN